MKIKNGDEAVRVEPPDEIVHRGPVSLAGVGRRRRRQAEPALLVERHPHRVGPPPPAHRRDDLVSRRLPVVGVEEAGPWFFSTAMASIGPGRGGAGAVAASLDQTFRRPG